ncbi:MAG: protein-glutamate O-methyltransferase CheR [Ilumatobacter sp.]
MSAQLSPDDSAVLREIVRQDSSIVLDASKDYLLENRLGPIMKAHEVTSFTDLAAQVRRTPGSPLRSAVVQAMTTNETSFFRDVHPWETMRTDLLPQLIETQASQRHLTFVCAACSSGQEPYTIAMLLHEYFPQIAASWRIRIMANDLSNEMVERTKAGVFSQIEVGRGMPAALLAKYFTRKGMKWEARSDLRSMIQATPGNLAQGAAWDALPFVDAVFLRNVLIYFAQDTKTSILRHAHARLKPTGFLMLGSSETTIGVDNQFEREQVGRTVVYRPTDTGRPAAAPPAAATSAFASSTPASRPASFGATPATPARPPTTAPARAFGTTRP